MLKNAYLDAKIGFDAAENEPSEKCGFGSCYMNLRPTLYEKPPANRAAGKAGEERLLPSEAHARRERERWGRRGRQSDTA